MRNFLKAKCRSPSPGASISHLSLSQPVRVLILLFLEQSSPQVSLNGLLLSDNDSRVDRAADLK